MYYALISALFRERGSLIVNSGIWLNSNTGGSKSGKAETARHFKQRLFYSEPNLFLFIRKTNSL